MAAHIGGVFEKELQKVFELLKERHLLGWHRLADTGAAGSIIAAQPSDYLVGLPDGSLSPYSGRLVFLEAKASESKDSLGKAMVRPAQRGAILRFRHLLGIPYLILFWSAGTGRLQLWDGIAVHGEKNISKHHLLAEWESCGTVNRLRHDVVAKHLAAYFQLPSAAATLAKVR